MTQARPPSAAPTVTEAPTATQAPTVTQLLSDFVVRSTWDEISPALRHQGKRALLNFFACAFEAAGDPAVDAAVAVMHPFSGPEPITLVGRADRLDGMGAAFINAITANFLDYDDTHFATGMHPTAPVVPPLLALGEHRQLSGAALLHALILGIEVACRIGLGVSPGHYARGWHITATCGVFGAAAGCAKLIGLSADHTGQALGIAASQSAGLVENLSTAAKNVGVGNAARNGYLAALLAQHGYAAAPTAVEGPLGWARAMGDIPDLARMTGTLGERWETADVAFKPYPAGFVFHAEIDACLALRARLNASPDDIAEVIVRGDQLLLDRGRRPVVTDRDARVSISHAAAVAFVRGRAGTAEFTDAAVRDPALVAFRAKVSSELDAAMPSAAASVTVRLKDGRTETAVVKDARGGPKNPLSDADLEAKCRDGARTAGLGHRADRIIELVWSIDRLANLDELLRIVRR